MTTRVPQNKEKFNRVIEDADEAMAYLKNIPDMIKEDVNENTVIFSSFPGQLMCDFMEHTEVVIAGGGIVFNEGSAILMILRKGMWDLPKGKIELNEQIEAGAVREVTEETGVRIKSVEPDPFVTYHAYILKGKLHLKQTSWYIMDAFPGQENLKPQLEEEIQEARWVPRTHISLYNDKCYPLVWDLVSRFGIG